MNCTTGRMQAHVELISLDLLEIDGDGALSRLDIVDIACSMRCQISMTILEGWDLEFSGPAFAVSWPEDRDVDSRLHTPRTTPRRLGRIARSHQAAWTAEAPW